MNSKRLGVVLLIGAVATLIWIFVCPTYNVNGETHQVSYTFNSNIPGDPGHSTVDYNHIDATVFWAGEVIIWSVTFGMSLLVKRPVRRLRAPEV